MAVLVSATAVYPGTYYPAEDVDRYQSNGERQTVKERVEIIRSLAAMGNRRGDGLAEISEEAQIEITVQEFILQIQDRENIIKL